MRYIFDLTGEFAYLRSSFAYLFALICLVWWQHVLHFRCSSINNERIQGARKDVQFADYFDKIDMNNLSRHAPVTKLSVRDGREKSEIKGRLLLITGYRQSLPLNRESFAMASPRRIFHFHSAKFVISGCSSRPFVTSNYFRA